MADLVRRIVAEFSAKNKAKGEMAGFRKDMDTTGQAMRRMAKGALAMIGMGGGIYALQRGFRSMISAAMEQEKAERALMAAVGENILQFKDYAAELQRQTVYGDELILQQMAYGANLGITTDKLKDATKAAIGLAAKYRLDLSAAMMLVGRASQGQTQMLTRYGIILDATLSDQEKFNEILKRGADAFRLAEEETKTTAGTWIQFKNAIGDVAEELGGPFLTAMTKAIKATMEYQNLWKEAQKAGPKARIPSFMPPSTVKALMKPDLGAGREIEAGREILAEQLADEAWAMKEFAKAYDEVGKIQADQAEQADIMQKHRMEMLAGEGGTLQAMEWRRDTERIRIQMEADAERIRAKTEAEKTAAQEIEEVWTEMRLREEEAAYHAWRAPIIAAEDATRESAKRRERINEDIALSMARSWSNAIDKMMFEGKKFWEAMEDMARSLTRMIANILIYRGIAEPIARGIMGTEKAQYGGVFTRPTLVQAGEVPEAFVPLKSGKIPVELSGGAAGERRELEMHVHYHGQEKPQITRAEEYLFSNRRIIEVTLQAFKTDANYRRAVQQVRR